MKSTAHLGVRRTFSRNLLQADFYEALKIKMVFHLKHSKAQRFRMSFCHKINP